MNKSKYDLVYKTQTTPFFPICLVAKAYSLNFKRLIGSDISLKMPFIAVINNNTVNWFFLKDNSEIGIKVLDKFFLNLQYFKKIKNKEKEISEKLLKEIKTSVPDLFTDKKLNKKGESKLQRIFQNYTEYGYFVDTLGFLFQLYYVDKFKTEIFKETNGLSSKRKEEVFNLLLSSYKKTNYENFLSDLYNHIFSKKSSGNLKKISENFYWVIHDYLGDIIDNKYLQNQINILKKKSDRELLDELKEIDLRIENIKNTKKLFSKDLQQKINMVQEILRLYNERKKEVLNKINIYIRRIIQYKFPQKNFKEIHKIYQLSPEEIINFLKDEEVNQIKERVNNWVYEIRNNQIETGNRKYLDLVIVPGNIKILKGIPTSLGKVTGKVSLILNISHIQNFKEGSILVAPFTNVNYLPIMRKSKAILTEVGGLTSHAAIVSRELKKPCIVGIKNLISILKDGDLVEVDAKKGIVRKLKNNE